MKNSLKILIALVIFLISSSNIPMYVISGNVDRRASVTIDYGDAWDKPPYPSPCEFSTRSDAQVFHTYSSRNGNYVIVIPIGWSGVVRPQPIIRKLYDPVTGRVVTTIKSWYSPCHEYIDVQENHYWEDFIIDDGTPKY